MSDNKALVIVLVTMILGFSSCAAVSEYSLHKYSMTNCPSHVKP